MENTNKIKVMGIDHGTTSGWSLFNCELASPKDKQILNYKSKTLIKSMKPIGFGYKKFNKETKLSEIHEKFSDLITSFNPSFLFIEKVNYAGIRYGYNSVLRLTEIRSMIKLVADENNIMTIEVSPTSMKKNIAGTGRATKMQVAQAVCKNFGIEVSDVVENINTKEPKFDNTDSIGLAIQGVFQFINNSKVMPEFIHWR